MAIQAKGFHKNLAKYFSSKLIYNNIKTQIINFRKLVEVPHQLASAGEWIELANTLSDLEYFPILFEERKNDAKYYWATVENNTNVKINDSFRSVINQPELHYPFSINLSDLLDETDYPNDAYDLLVRLSEFLKKQTSYKLGYHYCLIRLGLINMHRGNLDLAYAQFVECENYANSINDYKGIISSLMNQVIILHKLGNLSQALKKLDQCMAYEGFEEDIDNYCHALIQKASILKNTCSPEIINSLFEKALIKSNYIKDRRMIGEIIRAKATFLYETGDLNASYEMASESEQICNEIGDQSGLAESLELKGLVCKARNELEEAIEHMQKVMKIFELLSYEEKYAHALGNLAEIFIRQHRLLDAKEPNKRSIEIFRKMNIKQHLAISLINQFIILNALNEKDEALSNLNEAEELSRILNDNQNLGRILLLKSEIEQEKNSVHSEKYLDEAISLFENSGAIEPLLPAYYLKSTKYFEKGNYNDALIIFDKIIDLSKTYGFYSLLVMTLEFIAVKYASIGKINIAHIAADELYEITNQKNDIGKFISACIYLTDVLIKIRKLKEAYKIIDECTIKYKDILSELESASFYYYLGIIERESENYQKAIECFKNANNLYQNNHSWEMSTTCLLFLSRIYFYDLNQKTTALEILNDAKKILVDHDVSTSKEQIEQLFNRLIE